MAILLAFSLGLSYPAYSASGDDLELLDWEGVEVDLLESGDLLLLDESSELGDWSPFGLLLSTTSGSVNKRV